MAQTLTACFKTDGETLLAAVKEAAKKCKDDATAKRAAKWKRGCEVLVAASDAAKALKAADAAAAKKAKDDAAANKVADEEGDEGNGYEGDEKVEDGSMKPAMKKAMKAMKKSRKSEAKTAYQTEWQRKKKEEKRQKMASPNNKKALKAKKVAADAAAKKAADDDAELSVLLNRHFGQHERFVM